MKYIASWSGGKDSKHMNDGWISVEERLPEADNFNVVRRLTVLNARTDKPMFELIGTFSSHVDAADNQLEITCEVGDGEYKKHFIGLNDWTMYVIEDIGGAEVNKYKYEVNFLPESIFPITITSED